jgi:hypothetical protein
MVGIFSMLLVSTDPSSVSIRFKFASFNSALAFTPEPDPNNTSTGLTVDTDKLVYVAGETVAVDGKVDEVMGGEMVRLDFYDPSGNPLPVIKPTTEPNDEGFYSFSEGWGPSIPSDAKPGEYTFLATYDKQSAETKITVRQSGSQTQEEPLEQQGNPLGQLGETLEGLN